VFVAKFYDVTNRELWSDSEYPQAGFISCEIVSQGLDESGRRVAEIDTDQARGSKSSKGLTRFEVFADQLTPWPST
jgi:hypothetical protein